MRQCQCDPARHKQPCLHFSIPPADALIKLVPTLTAGLALWVCMTRAESPWALPLTLAAVPAAFHAYLLLTGTSLAQAQDAGWVLKPEVSSAIIACRSSLSCLCKPNHMIRELCRASLRSSGFYLSS